MIRRSLLAGVALGAVIGLALLALIDSRPDPNLSIAGGGAGINIEHDGPTLDPQTPLRTPAGRWITPGTVDEHGYTLPLDVKRPRPPRETPAHPDPDSIERARAARAAGLFPEVRLGPDDGHTQNETSIDALGSVVVAGWNNFTDSGLDMGYASSSDGGQTWVEGLIGGHSLTSDPAVKSGGGSLWYYAYLASPGPGGSDIDIYVRRSTDDGVTWGAPVPASNDTSFDDKPYLDALGNDVLVGFADFGFSPSKLSATRSIDGGLSFQNQTILSVNSTAGNGACPVIASDGTYHMFWRDSFQDSLWIATSVNQGATWSHDRGIVGMNPLSSPQPGGFRMVNLPSADADPVTGDLLVVWNDMLFGNADILAVRSSDGGVTWSAPVRVNDDAGTEAQFFPWVDFDEAGVASVVWYDRRQDGFGIDVYTARSTDGGATFETNVRVTAQSFAPVLPSEAGAASFIGDYNGIAATSTTIFPFYQDSREGNQDVWVARVPGSTVEVADTPSPNVARLRAAPSPFRTTTTITTTRADAEVRVFTAAGRHVRTLRVGADRFVVWDGRDGSGRPVSAGVYFATAPGEAGVRLMKLD